MTFQLSHFNGLAGLKVLRDGAFAATGKLSTPLDRICVPLRSAKYASEVNVNPQIAAVVTRREIADQLDSRIAVAVAGDPDAAHAEIHARLASAHEQQCRARPTVIDGSADVDQSARVASYGVVIGARARIGPGVTIAPGVTIEADCVLHPGVVLGVPGFNIGIIGGRQRVMPAIGGIRLRPHVELLANVCVAKAIFGGETLLDEECVADNLVYIAHDVRIGRRVQLCAMANVLGRVVIEDEAYVGPAAVIKNGLRIGSKAKISMGAVVTQDVAAGAVVTGNFAIPHGRFLEHVRSIR